MTKLNLHVGMIKELLNHDGSVRRLTDWEINFLQDVNKYTEKFGDTLLSAKQKLKIEDIWNEIFG